MSIASQPLPGAVAAEEHNDVDHTSVSLAVSTVILALRPKENETHPTLWLPLVRRARVVGEPDPAPSTDHERVVSVVYWASIPATEVANTRVHENIRWFPVDELPELAFDHNEIIEYALYRLQNKVEYSRIAHSLLGEEFTLAQLREVYEANFRRQIAASKSIIDTGRRVEGTRHRPPRLYRYNDAQAYADAGPLGMYRERHEA